MKSELAEVARIQTLIQRLKAQSLTVASIAIIYGSAIGTLLVGELLYAHSVSRSDFAQYSLVRTILPLISVATLLGVDQAITRELARGDRDLDLLAVVKQRGRLSFISAVVGALVSYSSTRSLLAAIAVALAAPAVIASDLAAAVLRGSSSYRWSAFVQQGYRLLLGISLIAMTIVATFRLAGPHRSTPLAVIVVATAAMAVLGWRRVGRPKAAKLPGDTSSLNRLGLSFGVSMLPFVALDWADQALLAWTSPQLDDVGTYAVTKLVTVYPLLSIASVAGFMLMPEIVKRLPTIDENRFDLWAMRSIAMVAALTVVWSLIAIALLPRIFDITVTTPAILALSLVGGLRLFYLLPSSVLGAAGSGAAIMSASLIGLPTLILLPIASYAGATWGNLQPVEAVAGGLLVSTAARVSVATRAARMSLQGSREQ